MTSPLARLAAFAVVLLLAAGGAAAIGSAVGDDVDTVSVRVDEHAGGATEHAESADEHEVSESGTGPVALPGLAVAEAGARLDLRTTRVSRPGPTAIAFRILGDDGRPIRTFDVAHGRRMHLVLVRRDLRGFQHLHPSVGVDGTWRVTARLPHAGTYRLFADFTRAGQQRTLGADLQVGGAFVPKDVPTSAATVRSDHGAEVRLDREGGRVAFAVRRAGRSVDDELEPYLGAKGHLVALRMGDLAYLHTHPAGDGLGFVSELPGPGRYRLWVQFRLDGVVHTAAFTEEGTR